MKTGLTGLCETLFSQFFPLRLLPQKEGGHLKFYENLTYWIMQFVFLFSINSKRYDLAMGVALKLWHCYIFNLFKNKGLFQNSYTSHNMLLCQQNHVSSTYATKIQPPFSHI